MSSSTSSPSSSSSSDCASTILDSIRQSTAFVVATTAASSSPSVTISSSAIESELDAHISHYSAEALPPTWAADYHFADGTDLTAQYVLVLDAMNFCFWPLDGYEYSDLAGSLKTVLLADPSAFSASALRNVSESTVESWLQPPSFGSFWSSAHPLAVAHREYASTPYPRVPIPLLTSRTNALREVGIGLERFYNGSAAYMVRSAQGDASRLVEIITATFPAFRDSTVYRGRQVFLYKRAQICVGDMWGAYAGAGTGAFKNVDQLTCFADYRVPQLLRTLNIMQYSPALSATIDSMTEILPSEVEIELRAATVQAVEMMVDALRKRGVIMMPLQIDWLLWERGEAELKTLPPHHRTTTIFY